MLAVAACTSSPATSDSPAGMDTAGDTASADTGDTAATEPPGTWIRIGDQEYDTLEAAGRAVRDGETIEICGEHAGPLDIEASAESPMSVSLQGCSSEWAVISGQGATHGVFALYTDLTLDSVSIVDGVGFTLEDTVCCSPECDDLCDRTWHSAGGLSVVRASVEASRCRFSGNRGLAGALSVYRTWIDDASRDDTERTGTLTDVMLVDNGEPHFEGSSNSFAAGLWGAGDYTLTGVDWGSGDSRAEHYELSIAYTGDYSQGVGAAYDLSGITNLHCTTDPAECVEF